MKPKYILVLAASVFLFAVGCKKSNIDVAVKEFEAKQKVWDEQLKTNKFKIQQVVSFSIEDWSVAQNYNTGVKEFKFQLKNPHNKTYTKVAIKYAMYNKKDKLLCYDTLYADRSILAMNRTWCFPKLKMSDYKWYDEDGVEFHGNDVEYYRAISATAVE